MMEIYKYVKKIEKVNFENIPDGNCFYSNGVLYKKILEQDLKAFGINNVNAVSIFNGGLTFFGSDEKVFEAEREYRQER